MMDTWKVKNLKGLYTPRRSDYPHTLSVLLLLLLLTVIFSMHFVTAMILKLIGCFSFFPH